VNAVFTAYVGQVQAERVQAGRARGGEVQARDRLHEDVMGLGVRVRWHPRRVSGGVSLWAVGRLTGDDAHVARRGERP